MTKIYSIIGGGTSGTTILGQLVDTLIEEKNNLPEPVEIVMYEKEEKNLATGLPYNIQSSPVFLLNGPPAHRFKLLPRGETLKNWMQENYQTWKNKFLDTSREDQFPPCGLVGHYCIQQYEDIKKRARANNIIIKEKFEEVIDVRKTSDSNYEVVTKNGTKTASDKIILCFGHLPSDNFIQLNGKPNYIHNARDSKSLAKIPAEETVYIIGGHLSFIDAAKELVISNNFNGKLVSVTRHPTFITLRDNEDKCDRSQIHKLENQLKEHSQNSLSWDEFEQLFWQSYQKSSQQPVQQSFFQKSYGTKDVLKYQLSKLDKAATNENGNFDELRDFMTEFCIGSCYKTLWNVLDEKGKESFTKHFYSLMVAFVAGIPPANARFLVELYENNRIEEQTGLSEINYDELNQMFILKFENGTTIPAKYVVNATGAGRDIKKHLDRFPLLANLEKNGLINLSKWGGFELTDTKNMFAINPIINHFEGKPGLSAVFLACHAAQEWIEKNISSSSDKLSKPSCF